MAKENNLTTQNHDLISMEEGVISKHDKVSQMDTPSVYIKQQQGFDYVDEGYMRHLLNAHYPIWKWEIVKYEILGDKVIIVHGKLTIMDNGIERSFDAVDAHRIASNQKGYVDIGNDLKSANTDCFKVAVNRLCNVADDVYRKRIEDIGLSADQAKKIESKLNKLDKEMANKIEVGIKNMTINATNFNATMRRIESLIGD